jgi:hypothetical protein
MPISPAVAYICNPNRIFVMSLNRESALSFGWAKIRIEIIANTPRDKGNQHY